MRIIKRVDSSILDGHVAALLKNAVAEPTTLEAVILRTMEVRLVQYREDGGEYAREILEILRKIDETVPEPCVFKGAIEVILTELRNPREYLNWLLSLFWCLPAWCRNLRLCDCVRHARYNSFIGG